MCRKGCPSQECLLLHYWKVTMPILYSARQTAAYSTQHSIQHVPLAEATQARHVRKARAVVIIYDIVCDKVLVCTNIQDQVNFCVYNIVYLVVSAMVSNGLVPPSEHELGGCTECLVEECAKDIT